MEEGWPEQRTDGFPSEEGSREQRTGGFPLEEGWPEQRTGGFPSEEGSTEQRSGGFPSVGFVRKNKEGILTHPNHDRFRFSDHLLLSHDSPWDCNR